MAKKPVKNFDMMIGSSPVLFHVPHGSSVLPDVALGSLIINDDEVASEILSLTSSHTDTLASYLHSHAFKKNPFAFINKASLLAMDPAPLVWEEAIPTHGSKGQKIRVEHEGIQNRLMKNYYEPYMRSFSFFSKNVIANHGRVIILNLHSYSSETLGYESNVEAARPDISLGTNDFHTPDNLLEAVKRSFETSKYSVGVNEPFKGAFVPEEFLNKNTNVMAITVNIRKDVYMDEKTGKLKDDEFKNLKAAFVSLCESISTIQVS